MIDRREFLQQLVKASAAMGAFGCTTLERPPIGLRREVPTAGSKGLVYFCVAKNDDMSLLRILDWDGGSSFDVPIPLGYPHSIAQDPENPTLLYSFEAFGSLAKFDTSTGVVGRVDHLHSTSMFDGHGILTHSRDRLICTELDKGHGTIATIRDAKSLERIGMLPNACFPSHQIVALPGTTVVACANLQNPGSNDGQGGITFYDYEKNAVVKKVVFEHPVIHLTALSASEALGISRPTTFGGHSEPLNISHSKKSVDNLMSIKSNTIPAVGPVCFAGTKGESKTYFDDSRRNGLLGGFGVAAIPKSEAFLTSHYDSNSVVLWEDSKIVHTFHAPGAMNLMTSADGSEFMVLGHGKLHVFSLAKRERVRTVSFSNPILLMGSFRAGGYG